MKKVIWEEIGGERKEKIGSSKVILLEIAARHLYCDYPAWWQMGLYDT